MVWYDLVACLTLTSYCWRVVFEHCWSARPLNSWKNQNDEIHCFVKASKKLTYLSKGDFSQTLVTDALLPVLILICFKLTPRNTWAEETRHSTEKLWEERRKRPKTINGERWKVSGKNWVADKKSGPRKTAKKKARCEGMKVSRHLTVYISGLLFLSTKQPFADH